MFRRALNAFGLSPQTALLSEREFASRLLTNIVEAYPDVPIAVTGDLTFTLNPGLDKEHRVDLSQHYGLYLMEPERLDMLVQLHTNNVSESMKLADVAPTLDLVVPLVWRQADLPAAGGDEVVNDPLTNELAIVYAFNLPHRKKLLTTSAMARFGLDADALRRRAIENATHLTQGAVIEVEDGVALITCSACSPSALLFVPGFWRQGALADIASIAAIVPDEDHVIAFNVDSPKAVLDAGQVAAELLSRAGQPLSGDVMLIKVDVPADNAAAARTGR